MNHRLKGGSQKMMNLTVQWPWLIAWMVLSQSEGGDGGWRKGADVRAPPSSCPCGPWGTETPLGDKKGGPSFSARSLKTLWEFCFALFHFPSRSPSLSAKSAQECDFCEPTHTQGCLLHCVWVIIVLTDAQSYAICLDNEKENLHSRVDGCRKQHLLVNGTLIFLF